MPFPRASQALSRVTVLDLTRVRSGPTPESENWRAGLPKRRSICTACVRRAINA
jgi:hypothetical protein